MDGEKSEVPRWRKEVEEILRTGSNEDSFREVLKTLHEIIGEAEKIEMPSGEIGKAVAKILSVVSRELPPLPSSYTCFMIGVAYERVKDAS